MKHFIACLCLGAMLVGLEDISVSAQDRYWTRQSAYPSHDSNFGQYGSDLGQFGSNFGHFGLNYGHYGSNIWPYAIPPNTGDPDFHRLGPERVGAMISDWYVRYLGRQPNPGELDHWVEFVHYRGILPEARVGIMASPECFELCRNDPHIYVRHIFSQLTGREPSSRELQTWVSLLHHRFQGERRDFCRALVAALE